MGNSPIFRHIRFSSIGYKQKMLGWIFTQMFIGRVQIIIAAGSRSSDDELCYYTLIERNVSGNSGLGIIISTYIKYTHTHTQSKWGSRGKEEEEREGSKEDGGSEGEWEEKSIHYNI